MGQTMSLLSKRELLAALREPYNSATYAEKKRLLDGFQAATGCSRKHAIKLMRKSVTAAGKDRAPRSTKYDQTVKDALSTVWQAAGCICAKRLIPFLPEFVPALERCHHIKLKRATRKNLLQLSAATADRMLKSERQRLGRSVSMTRRGNLLRRQIAVRTGAPWDDVVPGFLEGDLVAHNGGNPYGQFIHTLTLTDIASGWTECIPVIRKGDDEVLAAIKKVRNRLPMPLLGLDTDNGSEFINHKLSNYCKQENITFTRSRVFKSNDQAHVEEKNGSVVRRLVGYRRFEGEQLCRCMNELYKLTRLYVNYFQPSSKLQSKHRDGGHVTKRYDKARTPCQRLLELDIDEEIKRRLRTTFRSLNPVELLSGIESLQEKLDAKTKEMLRIPALTAVSECEQLFDQTKDEKPPAKPKTGRKSIVSAEVRRVISFLLHQDPSLCAMGLLPLLGKRYPRMFGIKQRGTLARQVRRWRAQHPEYKRFFPKQVRG
jgi:hypothetical protein